MRSPYLDDGDVRLYLGDCMEVMAEMDEGSVDAVVCDPPYGLEFMGKEWDSFAPAAMRKRSGWDHAASGAGIDNSDKSTPHGRTGVSFHKRRATSVCSGCGKRDAFRNDHPCTQTADWKHEWVDDRPSESMAFAAWCETWAREALRVLKPGGHLLAFGGTRTFHRLTCGIEDAGFEVRDCLSWLYGSGFPKSLDVSKAIDKAAGAEREVIGTRTSAYGTETATGERMSRDGGGAGLWVGADAKEVPLTGAPATDAAQQWQGWGTALKPAWEPCVVARKPLTGTVAANVQAHGTGAINVDGCRIPHGDDVNMDAVQRQQEDNGWGGVARSAIGTEIATYKPGGRWPANVILDEQAAAMLDAQSGVQSDGVAVQRNGGGQSIWGATNTNGARADAGYGGTGGASRFFYTAKASRADRSTNGANNTHPTVKPTDLMRWLVRLVTPPGGVVLDPFAGSGSTLVAARAEGVRSIGIEREDEYARIIAARLSQLSLLSEDAS